MPVAGRALTRRNQVEENPIVAFNNWRRTLTTCHYKTGFTFLTGYILLVLMILETVRNVNETVLRKSNMRNVRRESEVIIDAERRIIEQMPSDLRTLIGMEMAYNFTANEDFAEHKISALEKQTSNNYLDIPTTLTSYIPALLNVTDNSNQNSKSQDFTKFSLSKALSQELTPVDVLNKPYSDNGIRINLRKIVHAVVNGDYGEGKISVNFEVNRESTMHLPRLQEAKEREMSKRRRGANRNIQMHNNMHLDAMMPGVDLFARLFDDQLYDNDYEFDDFVRSRNPYNNGSIRQRKVPKLNIANLAHSVYPRHYFDGAKKAMLINSAKIVITNESGRVGKNNERSISVVLFDENKIEKNYLELFRGENSFVYDLIESNANLSLTNSPDVWKSGNEYFDNEQDRMYEEKIFEECSPYCTFAANKFNENISTPIYNNISSAYDFVGARMPDLYSSSEKIIDFTKSITPLAVSNFTASLHALCDFQIEMFTNRLSPLFSFSKILFCECRFSKAYTTYNDQLNKYYQSKSTLDQYQKEFNATNANNNTESYISSVTKGFSNTFISDKIYTAEELGLWDLFEFETYRKLFTDYEYFLFKLEANCKIMSRFFKRLSVKLDRSYQPGELFLLKLLVFAMYAYLFYLFLRVFVITELLGECNAQVVQEMTDEINRAAEESLRELRERERREREALEREERARSDGNSEETAELVSGFVAGIIADAINHSNGNNSASVEDVVDVVPARAVEISRTENENLNSSADNNATESSEAADTAGERSASLPESESSSGVLRNRSKNTNANNDASNSTNSSNINPAAERSASSGSSGSLLHDENDNNSENVATNSSSSSSASSFIFSSSNNNVIASTNTPSDASPILVIRNKQAKIGFFRSFSISSFFKRRQETKEERKNRIIAEAEKLKEEKIKREKLKKEKELELKKKREKEEEERRKKKLDPMRNASFFLICCCWYYVEGPKVWRRLKDSRIAAIFRGLFLSPFYAVFYSKEKQLALERERQRQRLGQLTPTTLVMQGQTEDEVLRDQEREAAEGANGELENMSPCRRLIKMFRKCFRQRRVYPIQHGLWQIWRGFVISDQFWVYWNM